MYESTCMNIITQNTKNVNQNHIMIFHEFERRSRFYNVTWAFCFVYCVLLPQFAFFSFSGVNTVNLNIILRKFKMRTHKIPKKKFGRPFDQKRLKQKIPYQLGLCPDFILPFFFVICRMWSTSTYNLFLNITFMCGCSIHLATGTFYPNFRPILIE